MAYSGGNLARKTGANWRHIATACRRARETAAASALGLIGNTSDAASSSASDADATRKNSRARCFGFKCAEAMYASTQILKITSSALGDGNSATGSEQPTLISTPTRTVSPTRGCTFKGGKSISDGCDVVTGSQILRRSIRRTSRAIRVTPPGAATALHCGRHCPGPLSSSVVRRRSQRVATLIECGKSRLWVVAEPKTTTRELASWSSMRLRRAAKNRALRFAPSPSANAATTMPRATQWASGGGRPFPFFAMSSAFVLGA